MNDQFGSTSDLFNLFKQSEPGVARVVIAAPGTGKSTAIVAKINETISNPDLPALLILTDDKSSIAQMVTQYYKTYGKDVDDTVLFTKTSETNKDWKRCKSSVRVIVSHHTYINRKNPLSVLHYELMDWVKEYRPITIIDEADVVVEKAKINIKCGFRYTPATGKQPLNIMRSKCRSRATSSHRCNECKKQQATYIRPIAQRYGGGHNIANSTLSVLEWNDIDSLINIHASGTLKSFSGDEEIVIDTSASTLARRDLVHNKNWLNGRDLVCAMEDEEGEEVVNVLDSTSEVISDIVNSCFEPMMLTYKFDHELYKEIWKKAILKVGDFTVSTEDMLDTKKTASLKKKHNSKVKSIVAKLMDEAKLTFPYHACNIPEFQGFDKSGIHYLAAYSEELILTSATFSNHQERFLNEAIPDLEWVEYTGSAHKAINNLLVITIDKIEDKDMEFSTLIDTPNGKKSYAQLISDSAPFKGYKFDENNVSYNGGKAVIFQSYMPDEDTVTKLSNQGITVHKRGVEIKPTGDGTNDKCLIAYLRSSAARGINMGSSRLLVCDKNTFSPAISKNWSTDEMSVEEHHAVEQQRLCVQAVGRIARSIKFHKDDGEFEDYKDEDGNVILEDKIIIIHNSDEEFGDLIGDNFNNLVSGSVKRLHYETSGHELKDFAFSELDSLNSALESTKHFFANGEVKRFDIQDHTYLSKTPWSKVKSSIKDRIIAGAKANDIDPEIIWNRFREDVKMKRKFLKLKIATEKYDRYKTFADGENTYSKKWLTDEMKEELKLIFIVKGATK